MLDLLATNLVSPMVLFFVLGLGASLARSDLSIPEAIARTMALYLMMAIGFKGGVSVAEHGADLSLATTVVGGAALSFVIPFIAFGILRLVTGLGRVDAAAVAAHYGSISIVTFVAGSQALTARGIDYEGYLVAVAAVMETPAIASALYLAAGARRGGPRNGRALVREIALNGSIVLLVGAFVIGMLTGREGFDQISAFIDDPFKGVLCLFLLDMGLVAGRGLRESGKTLTPATIAFGLIMPLISAALATLVAIPLGLSAGGTALFITLSASASYIAVPAAMRLALPEARPSLYLTLSLGITFPFNLTLGIPIYILIATLITGTG